MSEKLLRNDNGDLKELTDGQLAYAADLILRDFASSQSGVGTLVVSPNSLSGTNIGSFVDTRRSVAVGTHPVDGTEITSTTYTFRQNLSTVDTSSVVRPVKYKIPADAVLSYSLTSTDYEVLGEYNTFTGAINTNNTGGSLLTFTVGINWDAVSGVTGYTLSIGNGGSGWQGNNTRFMIKVLGSELGGEDGVNDLYVIARRQSGGTGNVTHIQVSTSGIYTSQKPQSRNFDIAEMTDTNLTGTLIGKCLTTLTAGGIGSYALQPSAPTNGTWTEILTINNLTQTSTNSTKLWRKTNDTAVPSFSLPLKLNNNADLQEMTTTEVEALSTVLRKAIVDTGRGTYALSTTAPSGGTWVRVGQAFKDTRQKIGAQSFVLAGGYSGAGYSKNYIGTYNKTYIRDYVKAYSGPLYSRLYVDEDKLIATYSKTYTGAYSRVTRTASYTGDYLGFIKKDYVGVRTYRRTFGSRQSAFWTSDAKPFSSYFSRYYQRQRNQSFSTPFTGDYIKDYGRNSAVSYENQYLGSYKTIAYDKGYVKTYENVGYEKQYTANFIGSYSGNTILSEQEDVSEVSLWVRVA